MTEKKKDPHMVEIGRKGGKVTSWAKILSNRSKARYAAQCRWHPEMAEKDKKK